MTRLSNLFYCVAISIVYIIALFITELAINGIQMPFAQTVLNTFLLLLAIQIPLFILLILSGRKRFLNRADDIFYMTLLVGGFAAIFIIFFRIDYSNRVLATGLFYLFVLLIFHTKRAENISKGHLYHLQEPGDSNTGIIAGGNLNPITLETIRNVPANSIIVHSPRLNEETLLSLLLYCREKNITLMSLQEYVENIEGRVAIQDVTADNINHYLTSDITLLLKRSFDLSVSASALIILSPLLLLTSLAIRIETPGKALYSQERVGRGGVPFTIFKLRSMSQVEGQSQSAFATEDEYRITKIGAFIRRSRIDEIPQLWNVLKGDMSLIGPRPEQAYFVKQFEKDIPNYSLRHLVRPGITGWAQVMQGYAADTESTAEKLSYDLYYIKNLGLTLDLLIIIRTLKTILSGFGSR